MDYREGERKKIMIKIMSIINFIKMKLELNNEHEHKKF